MPPKSRLKAPPPHPNPDSPHFQFLLPKGYLVHSLHFGHCWFVRQWGQLWAGCSSWLIPHSDTRRGFAQYFCESVGFYFNLHITKTANILHVLEMLETSSGPFFWSPYHHLNFPKPLKLEPGAWLSFLRLFVEGPSVSWRFLAAHPGALSLTYNYFHLLTEL